MNVLERPILLEMVVSTPCCGGVSEIYKWRLFEGNSETSLETLINEEQEEFYKKNPQYTLRIKYEIADQCLFDFSPKSFDSRIERIIRLKFVPLCIYDYRSLTESQLRDNAIAIISLLKNSHSFLYFPDGIELNERDRERLPEGIDFKNENEFRIILYSNFEYNARTLHNPYFGRFLDDYLHKGGRKNE